jgi:parallel beta-helix repeat protein
LVGKHLEVAANSSNVVIRNLTIDAFGSDERALVIGQGASRIVVENVAFRNYAGSLPTCLLSNGNIVELNNLTFTNVSSSYPIRIQGSNVLVKNSVSSDLSKHHFIVVGGGISNISIIGNTALNRPLLAAFYSETASRNILIENNTNHFPNGTYALLMQGGIGTLETSHENVTVKGNFFKAAEGAWNAISIYGLTKNSIVVGNTVDMTLSGHNGIGISSGVNVTVVGNVVYGALEPTEGAIEVESNPVHNRGAGFSENVTITGNTVYNSVWGIYVRVMITNHPNWNGTMLLSRNILIENNIVYDCKIGINLLQGEKIFVRNNDIAANAITFKVDPASVFQYTVADNIGYVNSNYP